MFRNWLTLLSVYVKFNKLDYWHALFNLATKRYDAYFSSKNITHRRKRCGRPGEQSPRDRKMNILNRRNLISCAQLQGEHKVFPWIQTFITRKLHGIQIYFFYQYVSYFLKKLLDLNYIKKNVCIPRSFLVINVCN